MCQQDRWEMITYQNLTALSPLDPMSRKEGILKALFRLLLL